jgi:cytochrome bd-type quinol oxidase subunit 2
MSAAGFSSASTVSPTVARSLAVGLAFGVMAALFAGAGLIFCGIAAYMSLTTYLEPPLAALAVGGGSLVVALVIASIGMAIVKASANRMAGWAKSSALIAMAPHLLRFARRHARLFGLVSAAGTAYFATRSKGRI